MGWAGLSEHKKGEALTGRQGAGQNCAWSKALSLSGIISQSIK